MAPATFDLLLRRKAGQRASINGATQIRAGVIRPRSWSPSMTRRCLPSAWPRPSPKASSMGDTVRGTGTPWFGRIGTVVGLPVEPTVLDAESKARVMDIASSEPDGGTVVAVVPCCNVETSRGRRRDACSC